MKASVIKALAIISPYRAGANHPFHGWKRFIQKKEIIAQKQEKTKKSRIGKTERYFLWLEAMSLEGLKCLKKFWFLLMDPKLPGMP